MYFSFYLLSFLIKQKIIGVPPNLNFHQLYHQQNSTMTDSTSLKSINVKSMISIFENQAVSINNEPIVQLKRTKSVGHLTAKRPIKKIAKNTSSPSGKNLELAQIEHQVRHLQRALGNYKKYSRENHIYYQNQIFFLLTDIVNVDAQDDPRVINEKSELMEVMKRLNKDLNALLPSAMTKNGDSNNVKNNYQTQKRASDYNKKETLEVEPDEDDVVDFEEHKEEQKDQIESEELDAPTPSVKSLKQLFEQNTTDIELKREFGHKLARKYNSFNSIADFKYVSYSEKFKSTQSQSVINENDEISNDNSHAEKIVSTADSEQEDEIFENDEKDLEQEEHHSSLSNLSSTSESKEEQNHLDDELD